MFLSRINWKKGLDRLITAWQWVPDLPLVIAGNDDENYRPRLEELARSLGGADRGVFVGPARDAHKWALYERAQLFVLPSYSENFGNVVAEAMAMGCPSLITAEVGIAPLVAATGAGKVVSGKPEELAAGIVALLADPTARQQMGRKALEAARTHLSWPGIAAQAERPLSHDSATGRQCGRYRMKRQLSEIAWVVGGQAATAIGTLVGVRVLTQFLTPAAYGTVSLALGLSTLAISLVAAPITQAAIHFYPRVILEGSARDLLSSVLRCYRTMAPWIAAAALLAGVVYVAYGGGTPVLVLLVTLLLASDCWRSANLSLLNAERRQSRYALWMASDAWSRPLAAVAAVLLLGRSPVTVLAAYVLVSGVLLAAFSYRLWPARYCRPRPLPKRARAVGTRACGNTPYRSFP